MCLSDLLADLIGSLVVDLEGEHDGVAPEGTVRSVGVEGVLKEGVVVGFRGVELLEEGEGLVGTQGFVHPRRAVPSRAHRPDDNRRLDGLPRSFRAKHLETVVPVASVPVG